MSLAHSEVIVGATMPGDPQESKDEMEGEDEMERWRVIIGGEQDGEARWSAQEWG